MESAAPLSIQPNYAEKVIRYEWYPWLWLTGYGRNSLIYSDMLLKLYPTRYDTIHCRFFPEQPFCRCHVVFDYSGKKIPIYEEFTFNPQGEITFIEAWSDYPGLLPMPASDVWATGDSVKRLSTRIPGLGNAQGRFEPEADYLKRAAAKDPLIRDLLDRIQHPVSSYLKALKANYRAMEQAHLPPKDSHLLLPYSETTDQRQSP